MTSRPRIVASIASKLCVVALSAAAAVALESFAVVVIWAIATVASRQSFGEGEALFEASRIRAGLPLYFDGVAGAFDYGSLPTHYYVLYTPLWPALLSLLPAAHALTLARAFTTATWLVVFGVFVAMAARAERRRVALYAAYFAGVYNLVIFATSDRHDMLAVGLAAMGLARSLHARRVDALAGALFALGAWVKPNVLGLAGGAFLVQLVTAPGALLPGLVGAAGVTAACAFGLDRASGGAWFEHLFRSTSQPLTWGNWLGSIQKDLVWFGAPIAFAAWAGLRSQRPGARQAVGSLGVATIWTLFLMSKTGRGSNYWLEPCVAAVATLSAAGWPGLSPATRPFVAGVALFQALWVGVASNRSVFEALDRGRAHARIFERARSQCLAGDGIVLSNDTGDEFALDGRIVMPAYQFSYLVRSGKVPEAVVLSVVEHPQVRCYLEHAPTALRNIPDVAAILERDYVQVDSDSEWKLLVRRHSPAS